VEMSMLGIGKDSWHTIHLYLGIILLGLLLLHIVLHWKQIVALFRKFIVSDKTRLIVVIVFIIISILLATFPFIISPTIEMGFSY